MQGGDIILGINTASIFHFGTMENLLNPYRTNVKNRVSS